MKYKNSGFTLFSKQNVNFWKSKAHGALIGSKMVFSVSIEIRLDAVRLLKKENQRLKVDMK